MHGWCCYRQKLHVVTYNVVFSVSAIPRTTDTMSTTYVCDRRNLRPPRSGGGNQQNRIPAPIRNFLPAPLADSLAVEPIALQPRRRPPPYTAKPSATTLLSLLYPSPPPYRGTHPNNDDIPTVTDYPYERERDDRLRDTKHTF